MCVKTGYAKGDDVFCLKVAGGGGKLGGNTGMMQVYSQRTLRLRCLLQDEGILTEMRTAAASCLASRLLMPSDITAVGLVGARPAAAGVLACLLARQPHVVIAFECLGKAASTGQELTGAAPCSRQAAACRQSGTCASCQASCLPTCARSSCARARRIPPAPFATRCSSPPGPPTAIGTLVRHVGGHW